MQPPEDVKISDLLDPEQYPTLSPDQTSLVLGIGPRAVRLALERGELPCLRLGRFRRVPTAALRRLLAVDE